MKNMTINKTAKTLVNTVLYVSAIGISIFLLFFVIISAWIGFDVKRQCVEAKRIYKGDCIEALINVLDDDANRFRERNNAIWALGQLGDERARPVLEKYYTGHIPDREPLDKTISQYELKKAINLTRQGSPNITAFIWRYGMSIK